MRICDIFQDGDWLFNRLATTIPPDIQLKLKGLFVDPTSEDLLIRGGGSSSGEYSARSGYKWLVEQPIAHDSNFREAES